MTKQVRSKHKSKSRNYKCDYPGCDFRPAQRIDIEVSIFRGDDVVLNACKEHQKEQYHAQLLATEKGQKQL